MKPSNPKRVSRTLLIVIVLVLGWIGAALAISLRTAPFPVADVTSGVARCAVTNFGNNPGLASVTMFTVSGSVATALPSVAVSPNTTVVTAPVDLATSEADKCECVVPNAAAFRCAYQHTIDGTTNTVIEGR